MTRRTAKPLPCPWCRAKTQVVPELGGIGWRTVCMATYFGPAPCRVAGPIRADALTATDDWNEVVKHLQRPDEQRTPLPDDLTPTQPRS